MVHIWKVFGDAFGYKWLSQNGDSAGDTIKTWARSLWGQSDEDLLEGARNVVDVWPAGDFPPDLPAFRAYVKMAKEQRLSHSKVPLLDCHRAQPVVVTRWMAAIKKIGTPDAVVSFDAALAEVSADRGW